MYRVLIVILATTGLFLSACQTPPTAADEGPTATARKDEPTQPAATEVPPVEPTSPPDANLQQPAPERVEFSSEDGIPLVGTYYRSIIEGAPGLVLVHMLGSNRTVWEPYALQWQVGEVVGPFNVLAIDLRGHGESGGEANNRAAFPIDVSSALAWIREQPGVDRDHIVLIGASIGADSVADSCSEGCIGIVSLSPGSFTTIPYSDAVAALAAAHSPSVLCVAAESDVPSPGTCEEGRTAGLADYQIQIYPGSAHGTNMFGQGYTPPLDTLIDEFLRNVVN